ncbi:type I secretion system permease/ATPase [Bradyrhizobium sp. STM 3562]|uniref:type I secretion system permease/ATPase n=1 Tax=Bradyrhizobium sp. STM 3562 TaxID=578924 RepID=UPI003890B496
MPKPPTRLNMLASPQTPLQAALWACAGPLGLVFAYSCSYNLLLFAPSIYLLQIYDRVLSSRSGHTLLMLTLIVAFAVIVGGVLDTLRRAVLGRLGSWLEDRLRPNALSAAFELAVRSDPAAASAVYRDLAALRQFIESNACPMLFDALWAPLFLAVLFLIHPLLGVIAACNVFVLFALALTSEFLTAEALTKSGAALAKSYGRLATALGNIHLIRTMGMLDGAARQICDAAQEARYRQDVAQLRAEIVMLAAKPIRALGQVLMMGAAAWLVLDYGKSGGIIFATTLLFGRALAPVEGAIAGWKALMTARSTYRRLDGFLASAPAARDDTDIPSDRPQCGLVLDNIGVWLRDSRSFLLKGISFSVAPGECLAIIGPSGSGKSMLGQIIAGLSTPTWGRVLLDDIDVSVLREARGGRCLGYLPQDINLFGETIKEVIGPPGDPDLQKVIEAARLVGIHDTIMRLPEGYDTVIPNGGSGFSRGYRQRLGLARAFFGEPRLVVLDEPNASLDYVGERVLLDAIEQMKAANTIVVVVTHRMGLLAATNKIAIMEAGTVTAFGESEQIFETHLSRPQVSSQVTPPENKPSADDPSQERAVP